MTGSCLPPAPWAAAWWPMLIGIGNAPRQPPGERRLVMPAAQCMPADVKLVGVIAQDHRVTETFMRLYAAPQRRFGGDLDRVGCDLQRGQAKAFKMREPGGLISEPCLWPRRQKGDRRSGQAVLAQTGVHCVVQHVVGMAGGCESAQGKNEGLPTLLARLLEQALTYCFHGQTCRRADAPMADAALTRTATTRHPAPSRPAA
jgi:hypothetical protein